MRRTRRWTKWVLVVAASLVTPAVAGASSAVILPRTGGSGVGPQARGEAEEALARVLENDGWTLARTDELSTDTPARLSSCGPDDRCAWELRALLRVDVAVGLRVFGTEDHVDRVTVVVVGARGVGLRAAAHVTEDQPLPFAVAEAARTALTQRRAAETLWDEPEMASSTPRAAQQDASPLNFALGGMLVLGSAPLLGFGINSAARDGECVAEGPDDTCVERIRFQEGAGIFTVLGAALFAAGIVVMVAQPIRMTVRASADTAALQLEASF